MTHRNNRARDRAIRDYQREHGISYAQARRAIDRQTTTPNPATNHHTGETDASPVKITSNLPGGDGKTRATVPFPVPPNTRLLLTDDAPELDLRLDLDPQPTATRWTPVFIDTPALFTPQLPEVTPLWNTKGGQPKRPRLPYAELLLQLLTKSAE